MEWIQVVPLVSTGGHRIPIGFDGPKTVKVTLEVFGHGSDCIDLFTFLHLRT